MADRISVRRNLLTHRWQVRRGLRLVATRDAHADALTVALVVAEADRRAGRAVLS